MKLTEIILEYLDFLKEINVSKRDYTIDYKSNYIITGIRRAGKTWFLFQIIKTHFYDNIEQVLYINFEDDRFIGFSASDFDKLLDAYYEIYPDKKPVLFLDEIQNIDGWHKFCRRMADQKYRVYITGSNSKMLSGDIASTLGGRFLPMEIKPLSFSEFVRFKGHKTDNKSILGKRANILKHLYSGYFRFGGFPELISIDDKRGYLHNIYTTVLYSDIVIKNKIRDAYSLRLLVKKLAESTNDELSYRRLSGILAASGAKIGTSTVTSWIEALKSSFLIRELKNFNYKFVERESKKKYYFSDNGLLTSLGVTDNSKLMETMAYNYLKTVYDDLWFYKNGNAEVDFVVPGKTLCQVAYDMNDHSTIDREVKALVKAGKRLETDNLLIITYNREENLSIDSKTIKIIPLWKLMLTGQ